MRKGRPPKSPSPRPFSPLQNAPPSFFREQVALDQTVGVALFFPTYFYVYELSSSLCTLRRPSFDVATQKLRHDLNHVLLNQYKVWPFINWVR